MVLDPLATLAERASDYALHALVPKGVQIRQPITVDELETLIEMRQEQGAIDASEASILGEVIDICDLTVRDCMVPRVDLTLVEAAKPEARILEALERTEARFVVIHGDTPDSVQGIVDSHEWKSSGRPKWTTLVQQPVFVPETFPALDALTQHLTSPKQCVLISDEYGGLEGMVTQDEVVDWLLYDAAPWQGEAAELRALDDEGRRYLVDGAARLDHITETLDVPLEAPGIDTIGGYVFNHLGYLPKPGERVKLEHLEIKVRRVARRRIQQVELRVNRENLSPDDSQPLTA
jgi:CBS domain containing-hemolysin-like protein